jgi:Phosphotransferase enzyme family
MVDTPTHLYSTFTAANIRQTLYRALGDRLATEDDLKLLRSPADHAVVAIPKLSLVARIGVSQAHSQRLARELELGAWLDKRGIPGIRPAHEPPTLQLTVIDERVITWWEYLPTSARGSVADLGALLKQLHSQPPPWPDLPALNPWSRVQHQLASATGLSQSDLSLLGQHWHTLRARWEDSRWPTEPGVVIHGDAYTGNTLRFNDTTYLLDFEDARIGPPQWDAASVAGYLGIRWIDEATYVTFCEAYGVDVRDHGESDVLIDIVLFRRTCWYASRTGREPNVVEAVRHRIATLIDPTLTKQWVPG